MTSRVLRAAIAAGFLLTSAAPAFAKAPASRASSSAPQAEAEAPWGAFGVQTRWMDPSVRAGDDFDRYVNGLWIDTVQIPPDRTRIGAFMDLRDLSEERLRGVLDNLVATSASHAPGSDEARLANAYSAFLDTKAIDAADFEPAMDTLNKIAVANSIPDLIGLFATPSVTAPIGLMVDADAKQSDTYALYIGLAGLGLPDRDYYLKDDARFQQLRKLYQAYLAFLLDRAGYSNPVTRASDVLALEVKLAKTAWDRAASRNRDLTYHALAPAQFTKLGPKGAMRQFLDAIGADAAGKIIVIEMPPSAKELKAAGISKEEAANLLGGGVPAALDLLKSEPIEVWRAWLAARYLSNHASVLPSDIDAASFEFYGRALGGQQEQRPRWKRAISAVESQIGELLGKQYAQKYYPPEEKAAMDNLVGNLREAMGQSLPEISWLGPETRKAAEEKLAAFTPKIGAPDHYKTYDGLNIVATNPLANMQAAEVWQHEFAMRRIGQPVDRSEWFMFPQTVNAYYNPPFNEIVFPAAILQPPFFNLAADPAVNYGAIGAVIGHEMGHGFDDQGAKSDANGNLRDWWTAADKAAFQKLQQKLVAQYDAYCPFDDGKTCINGTLTLGENIGDLGGLNLAYRAYKLSLGGKPAPVIDGFTGDQRFFLAWAQVWRSKVREKQARQFLITDPHSPPHYRINGIVRNFPEWYAAFDVKSGDALYLPPEERVRIW